MDLVSIAFIFLIGRRLYDWRTGLLAALLLALAVMPIQQSHFFTMDNWAASLTTMTLYTAVRAASLGDKEPHWQARWYLLFGLGLGLATASRINVAPLALMIGVGGFIWLLRRKLKKHRRV
jgi:4-amino-4-deoxy-L-arabinose transferase-like glycosyltransferase